MSENNTRTIEITLYGFDALPKETQDRLVKERQEREVHDGWHEPITDELEHLLETIGFEGVETAFSGFWSQGDGASFFGRYMPDRAALEKLITDVKDDAVYGKPYLEQLETLKGILDRFTTLTYATLERIALNYVHENTVYVNELRFMDATDWTLRDLLLEYEAGDVADVMEDMFEGIDDMTTTLYELETLDTSAEALRKELENPLRGMMRVYYGLLEEVYMAYLDEDYIREGLRDCGIVFTEDGDEY